MTPPAEHLVFAYGTLRRGGEHHTLLAGCPFLDLAWTQRPYCLVVAGIPFVNPHPPVCRIRGEVYRTDDRRLAILDELEHHPVWYRREIVPVITDSGRDLMAWLYFNPQQNGERIEDGDYIRWLERR
jgi:gamma-glutamylcyclotransferase (GGCT)/AIG2-like uncharacterized protein YtfP